MSITSTVSEHSGPASTTWTACCPLNSRKLTASTSSELLPRPPMATLRPPVFRSDGKLNFIAHLNPNRITCGYNGDRLVSLTHSSGQRLDLAYNASGRLASITDNLGRATRFTYDASGEHLESAEYYDGRFLRYLYALGQGIQLEHALREI